MAALSSFFSFLASGIQRYPRRMFWIAVAVHLVLWTLIPTLTDPNVLTDTIEGYAWGHEWPLGTYKHPPLAAWIMEIFAIITGRAAWAHFLISQLSVAIAFWAVWQTGKRMVGEAGALISALILVGVGYYNILIPEFNPNVLQLPFWALIGWSFYSAVKDNRSRQWAMLGAFCAGGLYTKYSTTLLLLSLAVAMILTPEGRKRLASKGPWLAVFITVLLCLPHIIWLVENHFMPFAYTESRLESTTAGQALTSVLLWQIAAFLPALIIYIFTFGRLRDPMQQEKASFDGLFLSFVTFGPFVLATIMAVICGFKIRNMWGAPFWNFIGLWVVFFFHPTLSLAALRRFAVLWIFVLLIGVGGYAAYDLYAPYVTHKASRIYFPGRALAAQIADAWQQRYHKPLRYVIGDAWVGGNVAYYAPERAHLLFSGNYGISPWINPADIERYGGVIVWCRGDCTHQSIEDVPEWYWPEFKDVAEIQTVLTIPQQTGASVPPAKIGWALLPPHEDAKLK